MDLMTGLAWIFTIIAFILFIIFIFQLIKRGNKVNSSLFDNYNVEERKEIEMIKTGTKKPDLSNKIIEYTKEELKTPFFTKKQNPFRENFFIIRDFIRDISRFGKRKEQKLNVLYLDNMGSLHFTTGYMMNENIEFFIGGLKILKGLNFAIKEKIYVGEKLYIYFFISHFYYENMNLKIATSKNYAQNIENLERDRTRIVDNDITKTFMDMDDNQTGMFRTGMISSFLGGFGLAIILVILIISIIFAL